MEAADDFDILKRNNWKFGTTIIFAYDESRREWEPNASCLGDRDQAVYDAHGRGIYTWVSVEPVIDVYQALRVMREMASYVDFWKVGKLNHGKQISPELGEIEAAIDWGSFLEEVEQSIPPEKLLIKHDLEAFRYAPRPWPNSSCRQLNAHRLSQVGRCDLWQVRKRSIVG